MRTSIASLSALVGRPRPHAHVGQDRQRASAPRCGNSHAFCEVCVTTSECQPGVAAVGAELLRIVR